jgi:PAS domain S-box-containing protein
MGPLVIDELQDAGGAGEVPHAARSGAGHGDLRFDRDLRFTLMEGRALAAHGWTVEEIVGRSPDELLPPGRREQMTEAYRGALAGEARAFDWPSVRGNAIFRVDVVPLTDGSDEATGGICVWRDVTDEHELQSELERQRGFLAAALEHLTEPVVIVDAGARVTVVNRAARALLGTGPDEGDADPLSWPERFGVRAAPVARRRSRTWRSSARCTASTCATRT